VNSYRIAEAAELLGVSDDTLRRWVEAGRVASGTEDGRTVVPGPALARLAESLADHPDRDRTRMVSLMSSEAADELGLEPGVRAIASVKSTNVVVERP
jgi:excisionase family DNA binding protein